MPGKHDTLKPVCYTKGFQRLPPSARQDATFGKVENNSVTGTRSQLNFAKVVSFHADKNAILKSRALLS